MIRNNRRFMAPHSLIAIALLFLSCGKESSSDSNKSSSARQNEEVRSGVSYKSQLLPLNTIVSGNSIGVLEWVVGSSKMQINLTMTNTPEDLEHFQAIHSGNRCPNESADVNRDGIIDMSELEKIAGSMVINLDSDLSNAARGDYSSSRANEYGNYTYWSEVSIRDLRVSPENKVIVVYGVNQNYNIPASVSSYEGNKHRYIPISCGVIGASSRQNLH